MAAVITKNGKNAILGRGFKNQGTYFSYMSAGVGTTIPTEDSVGLSRECTSQTHGNYSRALLTNTAEPGTKRMISSAIFTKDSDGSTDGNIRNSTHLKEIGITDTSDVQVNGNYWCICQIPDTVKDNTIELKFTIVTTVI